MSNFQDLFNLKSDDFKEEQKTSGAKELYKPNAKDGQDNVYKAVIRFIPFWKSPKQSIVKKYQIWLTDPATNNGFMVDCPSSIGKKSIIADTFFKLFNSKSAADKELAKKFSRKEYFYALVQIVKDKQNPDLEGSIKVFRFGATIYNKIKSEMEPDYGKPCVPMDLLEGKYFALHITQKGDWNNYELCKFVGEPEPLKLDGQPITKDQASMTKVMDFLQAGSPDLSKYFYQEWTDETFDKVTDVIKNTIPTGELVEQVFKANGIQSSGKPSAPKADAPKAGKKDDFDFDADFDTDALTKSSPKADDLDDDDLYGSL